MSESKTCGCGHARVDHDWWGAGECREARCVCKEFRLDHGDEQSENSAATIVVGVDYGTDPSNTVFGVYMNDGTGWHTVPQTAEGCFLIEEDPPDLADRQAMRVAQHQRDEAMQHGWRGDNWVACGCGKPKGGCSTATCTSHLLSPGGPGIASISITTNSPPDWTTAWWRSINERVRELGATPFAGVDRSQPIKPLRAAVRDVGCFDSVQPARPDGFAQSAVDQAKAVLLASVPKGKR